MPRAVRGFFLAISGSAEIKFNHIGHSTYSDLLMLQETYPHIVKRSFILCVTWSGFNNNS